MISENDILQTLRIHAGIDAAQTGEASLRMEIRRAISACPHPQRLLDPTTPEWKSLLENSLVPETWFFRNIEAFDALVRWATDTWFPAHPNEPLRVLSLPCATGEEPFSIAICLLEAGVSPDRFQIRAGDISNQSLDRARQAIYRRNSFRSGFDEARFGRYFDALGDGDRQVTADLRKLIDFSCMNLVHPSSPLPRSDVIFCRNALIYFGQDTQVDVIATLRAALSDDGILFLGPVEPPLALQCGFVTAKMPMAFACLPSHGKSGSNNTPNPTDPQTRNRSRLHPPKSKPVAPRTRPGTSARPSSPASAPPAHHSLEIARAHADAGDMHAADVMLKHLSTSEGPSPELFCLHGLVSEALDRGDLAEAYYRKALYLDPAHYETLAHLAALLELNGRRSAAASLRRRAQHLAAP
jgi:chemotaxis protein methyltransferase WspC